MYTAAIAFEVKPDHKGHFIENMREHARSALATEPGTNRFEIYQDSGEPNRIWLIEAYADQAALQHHLQQASHTKAATKNQECGCGERLTDIGMAPAHSI